MIRCFPNAPPKEKLKEELDWLEEKLTKLNNPIVFCHNDLLLGNILHEKNSHSIEFIDFEYAGPNYQAYDIANHFCEFAGKLYLHFIYYAKTSIPKYLTNFFTFFKVWIISTLLAIQVKNCVKSG